jgi:hypothetical protein
MAQLDRIRDAVRRQPFEPFTIRMADGTSCLVRHPDWLFIPPIKRPREIGFVVVPEGAAEDEFHTHWLNLALVSEVVVPGVAEMSQATPGSQDNGD